MQHKHNNKQKHSIQQLQTPTQRHLQYNRLSGGYLLERGRGGDTTFIAKYIGTSTV